MPQSCGNKHLQKVVATARSNVQCDACAILAVHAACSTYISIGVTQLKQKLQLLLLCDAWQRCTNLRHQHLQQQLACEQLVGEDGRTARPE